MQVAIRSSLIAGVTLVSAGAIAIAPIAPPMPDLQISPLRSSSAVVQLSAAVDPLTAWVEVIQTSVGNLSTLGDQILADPAPILEQIIANQLANAGLIKTIADAIAESLIFTVQNLPTALTTAFSQLAAGNVTGALDTLVGSVAALGFTALGALSTGGVIISNTVQSIARVVTALIGDGLTVLPVTLAVVGPALSVLNAAVGTVQAVIDAAGEGDFAGMATALINAPAALTGGFLNGYGKILGFFPAPGILTPVTDTVPFGGPIAALLGLRDTIAAALAPPADANAGLSSNPGALPNSEAKGITVTTTATTQNDAASNDSAVADNSQASSDADAGSGTVVDRKAHARSNLGKATPNTKAGVTQKAGDQASAAPTSVGDETGNPGKKLGDGNSKRKTHASSPTS